MRNCLHKCNRTQVKPATNEEAEGIETVTSLLPSLTEAIREGRTRHFTDITVEGDVMDVRLGRPDSQPEPELNARANSNASSRQPVLTWRLESVIAGFDFEKREIPRDIIWTHPPTGSRWRNCVGKCQDEPRPVNPLFLFIPPKQARPRYNRRAQPLQVKTQTGERLSMSMTEEGPSEEYRMTMQRDRHGRWMPTKGERTMNIQKAREERRSFYVGECKEHGTFSIASAEASPLQG